MKKIAYHYCLPMLRKFEGNVRYRHHKHEFKRDEGLKVEILLFGTGLSYHPVLETNNKREHDRATLWEYLS